MVNTVGGKGAKSAASKIGSNSARPREFDLVLIDEDPNQPRAEDNPGFLPESLAELASTIRQRGVKSPISLRENPESPGRYIINHGARRFRSSKLAEKTTIPGFIDNDYNDADQVIENLHRNTLTAREIADYIGRELAKGIRRREIAKSIGKSAAFVTQHAALLDLPPPIADVFNAGRVKDVTVINELTTAFKSQEAAVTTWLRDERQDITRSSVKLLRDFLDERQGHDEDRQGELWEAPGSGDIAEPKLPGKTGCASPDRIQAPVIQIVHRQRGGVLLIHRRPSGIGRAWIIDEDDGSTMDVDLADIRIVALLEK